jgi:hypothetical protein
MGSIGATLCLEPRQARCEANWLPGGRGPVQDELPPQAEMRIGGVDGFLPYRATATLLASALSDPPSLEEVGALRTPDLDKFLPPRRKGPSPASQRRRIELDFVHCPIVDLGIPSDGRCVSRRDRLRDRRCQVFVGCVSKGVSGAP